MPAPFRNPIRQAWAEGRTILNGWLMMPGAFGAELMAAQGFECLTIDMQHGLIGAADMVAMLQGARAGGTPALVRVPWLEPGPLMQALDAGAWGVICPMINSAEEARRLASYLRYPPRGARSMGPVRASIAHGSDYAEVADDEILCLAMIETKAGYEAVDEIAGVEGIDGIYVGPADLTLALTGRGYPTGFDREEPEMVEALQRIAASCERHGKLAALHCGNPDYAQKAVAWGYGLVTIANDARLIATGAAAAVKQAKDAVRQAGTAAKRS